MDNIVNKYLIVTKFDIYIYIYIKSIKHMQPNG